MKIINLILLFIFSITLLIGCNVNIIESNATNTKTDDKTYKSIEEHQPNNGLATIEEKVLFSFKTKKDEKALSISISEDNNYIIYRFGKNDKIELEYPENKADTWNKFKFQDYHRGGGEQNIAMDINSLYFINGNYLYEVYDEYKNNDRYVGVRVTNRKSKKVFEIEGNSNDTIGNLLFIDEKYPNIGNEFDYVNKLEGNWISADSNEYHGTDITINFTSIVDFDIEIYAFQLNAQGSLHVGSISGKGTVENNKIVFADDRDLSGEIFFSEDKLIINYIGDTTGYAGLNVSFANEFIKNY